MNDDANKQMLEAIAIGYIAVSDCIALLDENERLENERLRAENERLRAEAEQRKMREIDLIEKMEFILGNNRKSLLFYPLIVMPSHFQKYEERFWEWVSLLPKNTSSVDFDEWSRVMRQKFNEWKD